MTPTKIIDLTREYERELSGLIVPKIRMDPKRTFGSLTEEEHLAHAHHLCDGIYVYAIEPEQWGKTNRHFTAIQMCLSEANRYTLEDLMNHNRP